MLCTAIVVLIRVLWCDYCKCTGFSIAIVLIIHFCIVIVVFLHVCIVIIVLVQVLWGTQ